MNKPKFSILLPTKNRYKLLKSCVNSILEQDYKDYELIVSDNNSIDETKAYCKSISDKRLKYYRLDSDAPVTDNWNNAYSKAQGEYVIIVGDDDYLTKSFLFKINSQLKSEKHEGIVIVAHARYHFSDYFDQNYKNKLVLKKYTNGVHLVKSANYLKSFFNFDKTFHSAAICIKRNILDSIVDTDDSGPYKEPFPDYTAIFSAISLVDCVTFIDSPLLIAGVSSRGCGNQTLTNRKQYWSDELSRDFEFLPPIAGELFVNYYYISQKIVQSQVRGDEFTPNLSKYLKLYISELFVIKYTNKHDLLKFELRKIREYGLKQSYRLNFKIHLWLLFFYFKLQFKRIGLSKMRLITNRFNNNIVLITANSIKEASFKL